MALTCPSSDSDYECPPLFIDSEPGRGGNPPLFMDSEPGRGGSSSAEDSTLLMSSIDEPQTWTFGSHSVVLVHRTGDVGGKPWRATLVCAQALLSGVFSLEDKRVLELGAGVGIPGILASKLGAKQVILTDCCYKSLKGLLPNVLANCLEQEAVGPASWGADCDQVCVRRHLWDNDLPRSPGRPLPQHWSNVPSCEFGHEGMPPELPADSFFDVVIGSDLLYFPPQVETLLATLSTRLKQGGHALIALSVKKPALFESFLAGIPHSGLMLVSADWVAVDDQDKSHALSTFGQEVQLVHLTKL